MNEVGRKMVPGAKPVVLDHFDVAYRDTDSEHIVRQQLLATARTISDLFVNVQEDLLPEQDFIVLITVCKVEVYEESSESAEL